MEFVQIDYRQANPVRRGPINFSKVSTLPRDFKRHHSGSAETHNGAENSHRNSYAAPGANHQHAGILQSSSTQFDQRGRSFSDSARQGQASQSMAPGSGINSNSVSNAHYASSMIRLGTSQPSTSQHVYHQQSHSYPVQSGYLNASEYRPGESSQPRPASSQGYRPGESSTPRVGLQYGRSVSRSAPESGMVTPRERAGSVDIAPENRPPVKSNQEFEREFEAALNAFKVMGGPSVRSTAAAVAAQGIPLRSQTLESKEGPVTDPNALKVWSMRASRSDSIRSTSSTTSSTGKTGRRRSWVKFVRGKKDSSNSSSNEEYASWSALRKPPSAPSPTPPAADNTDWTVTRQREAEQSPRTPTATTATGMPQENHYTQPVSFPSKEGPVWMQDSETLSWRGCSLNVDGRKLRCESTDGKEPTISDTFLMSSLQEARATTWSSEPSEFDGNYFEVVTETKQCVFAISGRDGEARSWVDVINAAIRLQNGSASCEVSSSVDTLNMMASTSGESGYFSQDVTSPILQRKTENKPSQPSMTPPPPAIPPPPPTPPPPVQADREPATPKVEETSPEPSIVENASIDEPDSGSIYEVPEPDLDEGEVANKEPEKQDEQKTMRETRRSSLTLPLEDQNEMGSPQAIGRAMSIPASAMSATNLLNSRGSPPAYAKSRSASDVSSLHRPKPVHPNRLPPLPPKPKDDGKKKRWPTLRLQRKDKDSKESLSSVGTYDSIEDFNAQGPAIRRYNRITVDGASPNQPSTPNGSFTDISGTSPGGGKSPLAANSRSPAPYPQSLSNSLDCRQTPSPEESFPVRCSPSFNVLDTQRSRPPAEAMPEVSAYDLQTDGSVIMQNYLWKQETRSLLWNKWWVVLSRKSGILMYRSHTKISKPETEVALQSVSKINRILDTDGCIQEQRFEVVTVDKSAHLFSAPTGIECQRWISALREAVFSAQGVPSHRPSSQRHDGMARDYPQHKVPTSANLQQLKAALGAALEEAKDGSRTSPHSSRAPSTTPDRMTPVYPQPSPIFPPASKGVSTPDRRVSLSSNPRTPSTAVGWESTTPAFPDVLTSPQRPVNHDYCSPNTHSSPYPLSGLNGSSDLWKRHSPIAYGYSSPMQIQPQLIPTYQVENANHGRETMV